MTLNVAPSFNRARRLSRAIYLVLTAALCLIVAGVLLAIVALVLANSALPTPIPEATGPLTMSRRLILAGDLILFSTPTVIILFYLRTLFLHFAHGEVFTADNIALIRNVGLWLLVSAVTNGVAQFILFWDLAVKEPDYDFEPIALLYGAMTWVAAYIMAEARRIADDNASIV